PLSAETSQRLFRPLIFEINAMVLPSGDHVVPPTARVMYSFSMVRFRSTWALGLLVSCLGSVMALGTGRVWVNAIVLIVMTITNGRKVRMSFTFSVKREFISVGKNGRADDCLKQQRCAKELRSPNLRALWWFDFHGFAFL